MNQEAGTPKRHAKELATEEPQDDLDRLMDSLDELDL